ncbi:MAG: 8-amino-7-oxononanoate synthase [Reinekea sp.]|nr:8-amino-7-oxononanoate synthase [Reinekea sp.]
MKHFSEIPTLLQAREQQHLLRRRVELQSPQSVQPIINGRQMLSFCSNDYLGLANHPAIADSMKAAIDACGVGSGASHLIDGHHQYHEALERDLAAFCGREAALVFSTGYMANMGVMAALMNRQDTIIQDKLNHASLIDGAKLAQAKMLRYRHNDTGHLAQLLTQATGKRLVVTDGVFSMDGDCAPMTDLARVAGEHDAWVMVDDAHGFGVLGEQGAGLVSEQGLSSSDVQLVVGTLGKAFGTSGAFVAGDQSTIDYLLQFARTYIYTTATPPAVAAATRTSLGLVKQADTQRAHLQALIARLRTGLTDIDLPPMASRTPIQPVVIGSNERAMRISQHLNERGLLVTAIRPPTVPEGTARLRITLSATHSFAQIDTLLNALEDSR